MALDMPLQAKGQKTQIEEVTLGHKEIFAGSVGFVIT